MTEDRSDPTVLDYVEVLARRRSTILVSLGSAVSIALVLAFTLPPTYTARASVLPERGSGGSSLRLTGMLAALGNLAPGYALPGVEGGSPVMGILESRTLLDRVAIRSGLLDELDPVTAADTLAALERVRRRWSRRIRIDQDDDTSVIEIEVDARDAHLAASVANAMVDELNRLNHELAYSAASASRAFTERRVLETRETLAGAQAAFVAFQDRHGAIALDEQASETVRELAELEGEIVALRAAREAASVDYNSSLGTLKQLDARIAILDGAKRRIFGERPLDAAPSPPGANGATIEESSPAPSSSSDSVLLPLRRLPELSARYANLLLEVKIQESVLTVLHQELEQSKIEEARDVPVIQVLDRASPPAAHTRPHRSLMLAMGVLTGVVVGLALGLGQEWVARNAPEATRLRRLWRDLLSRGAA